jgi:GNAT superfamily N-acetyltransferase
VAVALADVWELLAGHLEGAWARTEGGAVACVTGVPVPVLNGVWAVERQPAPAVIAKLLDEVASTGLPYCLQLRPGAGAELTELAAARGLVAGEQYPVMALAAGGLVVPPEGAAPALAYSVLAPDDARVHARLAAEAFQAPYEVFDRLVTPAVLGAPEARCFVAEAAGEPVSTGIAVRSGVSLGIFNVGTPARYQRRGFGAALTAHMVADGFAHGALWAWLQSSPAGYGVYRKLGFITLETWDAWLSAGA